VLQQRNAGDGSPTTDGRRRDRQPSAGWHHEGSVVPCSSATAGGRPARMQALRGRAGSRDGASTDRAKEVQE
jgi:hypothetical protein